MTALDNAVAAHMAHAAASGTDPLTDSLCDQCALTSETAHTPLHLRAGWEHEPIEVPLPWRLGALVVVVTALVSALVGCGGGCETEDGAKDTGPVDCRARPELCQ